MVTLNTLPTSYKFGLSFVGGVIVGGGLYALFTLFIFSDCGATTFGFSSCTPSLNETATELSASQVSTTTSSSLRPFPVFVSGINAVAVNPQPAGETVEITMATFSQTGWVAIHEEDHGALGKVLGAQRFEPGIHLGEVELLRPTLSGGTYIAVLYLDTSDSVFNLLIDPMIKDVSGNIITATFTVY